MVRSKGCPVRGRRRSSIARLVTDSRPLLMVNDAVIATELRDAGLTSCSVSCMYRRASLYDLTAERRLGKGGAAGGPDAAANGAAPGQQPKGMNLAARLMEQMGWRGGGLGKTQQARSFCLDPDRGPHRHPAHDHQAYVINPSAHPCPLCSALQPCTPLETPSQSHNGPGDAVPSILSAWVSSIMWRRPANLASCEPTG